MTTKTSLLLVASAEWKNLGLIRKVSSVIESRKIQNQKYAKPCAKMCKRISGNIAPPIVEYFFFSYKTAQ